MRKNYNLLDAEVGCFRGHTHYDGRHGAEVWALRKLADGNKICSGEQGRGREQSNVHAPAELKANSTGYSRVCCMCTAPIEIISIGVSPSSLANDIAAQPICSMSLLLLWHSVYNASRALE